MDVEPNTSKETSTPNGVQISLAKLIPLVLAALVVFAVLPVVITGYLISTSTAARLLADRAELVVDGLENKIRSQLDPVSQQLLYARRSVLEGAIDLSDDEAVRAFALGLMGGTPQVAGVGFIDDNLRMRRWQRNTLGEVSEPGGVLPLAEVVLQAARDGNKAYWARPLLSPIANDTIMSYRVALEPEGAFSGVLVAAVTSRALSRYVTEISEQFGVTAFVLVGQDRVLTYPNRPVSNVDTPSTELPLLTDTENPVIARIWQDRRQLNQTGELKRTQGHWSPIDGANYTFFYRQLDDYGPEPLTIGVAIPSVDSIRERWASTVAAGLGLVLMLAAAVAAWFLGRRMTRPTAEFNQALKNLAALDFESVALPQLQKSRILEWRGMAAALVNSANALSAFQTYLPRSLVRRLFSASRDAVTSQERVLTVMFVDLEGFTAYSRGHAATEVADHLNDLFGEIGPILEQSGGVIDKYTGDGLLCFWGAPDPQPDHAARACRAAADIARSMERRTVGSEFPRLRVGLHTGPVVVGNIGFPGRINYTLVGDTVNIAERTEAALRGVEPELPCVIAVTDAVLAAGGNADGVLEACGSLTQTPAAATLCRPAPTVSSAHGP